ncbi:putative apicomplexan-specific [Cryptosporidium sp. chipmunk genotype I]|uniref:putative apicomplexan-specific n=1 Tax=Cryptosporidium sp. chipmunk genotype I TaxID=1280935 RepID=UPI003519EEAC|nr:putative apicomplexan-specific [Cryptosporidium sp. chipmunk genotype I]
MEQLEVVIKNNTRLTFFRYVQILDRGEWIYHPVEKISSGMMTSFVCSSATYQSILGCNVVYSVIVNGLEYFFSYKYESRLIGDCEANVWTGIIEGDEKFVGCTSKASENNGEMRNGGSGTGSNEIFYLDNTNGLQRSCKRLMTHINIRETESGNKLLDRLDSKDYKERSSIRNDFELNKRLNSNYYEWIKRLRTYPRSLYIRIVNLTDFDLNLQLPAANKSDSERFRNRNLANSTISSAVTPSMHIESHNESLITRGPYSPYSMVNLVSGGQWIEFPPEVIYANSVVEFGASCESLFSADFKANIVYRVSGYAGKVLFGWDFPAGFTPSLSCRGFHDLHNLSISSHCENFNDGNILFHIIDESKPPKIRLISVKAIFSENFLNVVSGGSTGEEKQNLSENILDQIFGKNNETLTGKSGKGPESISSTQNGERNTYLRISYSRDSDSYNVIGKDEQFDAHGDFARDVLPYFIEYIKPERVISCKEGDIFLYNNIILDSPRVLFSSLLASSNVNMHPKYCGNIDSISLFIEWSIGCEIFRKVWAPDEKTILVSSSAGGLNDCNSILNSIYPRICRRNRSKARVYFYDDDDRLEPGERNLCSRRLSTCQMNCFFLEDNEPEVSEKYHSHFEIALIGQQLLAQILAPYLVKYLKSSTLSKGGISSNISNSSRFSNTSTVLQGLVDSDHIWKYSKIGNTKGANKFEERDKQGILDFQGTINFLILHWDDLFCELFEKKLNKLSSYFQHQFNPDTLLCIIQRVSLLWENKDFEFFENPSFLLEFIDAATIICRIIENDENKHALNCLIKLRNSIKMINS